LSFSLFPAFTECSGSSFFLFVMGCCFGKESSGYQSWGSGRAGGASAPTQQDLEARAIAAERVSRGWMMHLYAQEAPAHE